MKLSLMALVFALCGCATGIQLEESARGVIRAHSLTDVAGCRRLGEIKATVSGHTAFVWSGAQPYGAAAPPQVVNEILIDARNKAAQLGGNRILATNEPAAMQQDFDVYRCS